MTTQVNTEVVIPTNPRVGMTTTSIRDFIRMNPLEFYGSKLEEDPQEFTERTYNIVDIMGTTSVEKEDSDAYQL